MKKVIGIKKYIKPSTIILFVILIFMVSDCAISPKFKKTFWHDETNPCTPGEYQNSIECNEWKMKYPKEYQRYKERMKEQVKSN